MPDRRLRERAPCRTRRRVPAILGAVLVLLVAGPGVARARVDLVRLDGVVGVENAPGTIVQTTLLLGKKSVPFSVLAAQRISGEPANGPGILLALGPGPPPIRVEGRDETMAKLLDAPAGSRAVITGNLQVGMAFLTLISAEITPSAPSPGAQ